MGGSLQGFNAQEVDPNFNFEAVPAGKYLAIVEASEWKETKNKTGKYLELQFQIIEGDFKGRNVWARLNLDNPNETAVKIARSELSALCRAVGVLTPNDSQDLHNLPVLITVKCVKRPDNGEMSNEIAGYAAKGAQAPGQAPVAQPSAKNPNTPPWLRNAK